MQTRCEHPDGCERNGRVVVQTIPWYAPDTHRLHWLCDAHATQAEQTPGNDVTFVAVAR